MLSQSTRKHPSNNIVLPFLAPKSNIIVRTSSRNFVSNIPRQHRAKLRILLEPALDH